MDKKPTRCPRCGSHKIATILYGMPLFSKELEAKLQSGEIVLGGCDICENMPSWQCVECGQRFKHAEEAESFEREE